MQPRRRVYDVISVQNLSPCSPVMQFLRSTIPRKIKLVPANRSNVYVTRYRRIYAYIKSVSDLFLSIIGKICH